MNDADNSTDVIEIEEVVIDVVQVTMTIVIVEQVTPAVASGSWKTRAVL